MPFKSDGFFNATAAAKQFGKRPNDWLLIDATKEYIAQVIDLLQLQAGTTIEQNQLVIVKGGSPSNGGGTWLHPKLATVFTRWLDTRFAVWADMQIDAIMRGDADKKSQVLDFIQTGGNPTFEQNQGLTIFIQAASAALEIANSRDALTRLDDEKSQVVDFTALDSTEGNENKHLRFSSKR